MTPSDKLRIIRPDDWHLHLRDGDMMRAVLPFSAQLFGRAIIMPNLNPPVRTVQDAQAYDRRIRSALPSGHPFCPLMTCYLTDGTNAEHLRRGFETGLFAAAKLYPAGSTTNSENGVTDIRRIHRVLETLEEIRMPLLLHGEVADPGVDVFDREAVFIDRVLDPIRKDFPELKTVFEHVTTRYGVEYIRSFASGLGATITPHHLCINRNAIFRHGIHPHMFCLPVAKREEDRLSLVAAAVSGDPRFFFGSDSAPHTVANKEKSGGSAGIFNTPTALCLVTQVFDENEALDRLEAFVSLNGARFYGMGTNDDTIVLEKQDRQPPVPDEVSVGCDRIKVFRPTDGIFWRVSDGLRPADSPFPGT